jgi:hypothetical protein
MLRIYFGVLMLALKEFLKELFLTIKFYLFGKR